MNRFNLSLGFFATVALFLLTTPVAAFAWDSTNPYNHGWDQPPTNDYSTYGGSSSRQDQADYLQNQQRLERERESAELEHRGQWTPPSFGGSHLDNPFNMPEGVWSPDGKFYTCQHGYGHTTYCQ